MFKNNYSDRYKYFNGDWGLGIGDWGLGIGDWARTVRHQLPAHGQTSGGRFRGDRRTRYLVFKIILLKYKN